jgi:tetratricopeptide (TPR) repeat protein
VLLVLVGLAACGGGAPPPATPVDETLQRETRAGRLAYELERSDEAVARYRAALTRAQERDDLGDIGDLGYNLSVAELRDNHPENALADARQTRAELERRGATPPPALLLVEATALYRLGAAAEAEGIAARVASYNDGDAAARATFLRGLIADEHGDAQGLVTAATALSSSTTPSLEADAAELGARLALRRNDFAGAQQEATRAAALRRDSLDYRGMARALALAGEATRRTGNNAGAADLFLRAGRSALAQGDKPSARSWLQESIALTPKGAVADAASDLLHRLESGE